MGGGLFRPKKRYMGGKSLLKFFTEDILPIMDHLLERLGFTEATGFEMFRHFASIDINENGVIDLGECLKYFVIERTTFSERVFYHVLDDHDEEMAKIMNTNGNMSDNSKKTGINMNVNHLKRVGLTFQDFVLLIWQYCTLPAGGIARYIYEIFDTENNHSLNKAYLRTIYQMMYNTTEVDEEYISFYPLVIVEDHVLARQRAQRAKEKKEKKEKERELRRIARKNKKRDRHMNRIKGSESLKREAKDKDSDDSDSDESDDNSTVVLREEITKSAFMEASNTQPALIQPAIDIQLRLRKQIGGKGMWDTLLKFRAKNLHIYDTQCDTLAESLDAIVESAENMKTQRLNNNNTEKILEQKQLQVKSGKEQVEKELKLLQKTQDQERKAQEVYGKDRPMKIAWSIYEQQRKAFEAEEFTTEDPYHRRERREDLYRLLDEAIEISKNYYEEFDVEELQRLTGTEDDHEYRYQDYIKTPEGSKYHTLHVVYYVFMAMDKQIKEKNRKIKNFDETKKTEKQQMVEANLMELVKIFEFYKPLYSNFTNKVERERAMKQLLKREFHDEMRVANKLATKADLTAAEQKAHDEVYKDLKKKTIFDAEEVIAKQKEERRKDYIRKDFEMASNLGSRITRYIISIVDSIFLLFLMSPSSLLDGNMFLTKKLTNTFTSTSIHYKLDILKQRFVSIVMEYWFSMNCNVINAQLQEVRITCVTIVHLVTRISHWNN